MLLGEATLVSPVTVTRPARSRVMVRGHSWLLVTWDCATRSVPAFTGRMMSFI